MSKSDKKKLSRRDAIKLIGAVAGASVLANLPSKWSTPQLAQGVLPAHAQTSSLLLHTLSCDLDQDVTEPNQSQYTSGVTISPPTAGIVMRWTVTSAINVTPVPVPNTGTVVTDGSGYASLQLPALFIVDPSTSTLVNVQWQFENAANGDPTDFCDQAFTYTAVLPNVTTGLFTYDFATDKVTLNGDITLVGSTSITDYGFVMAKGTVNQNPTIGGPGAIVVSLGAGGAGLFQTIQPGSTFGFNEDIYGRAFATNSVGTAYGTVTSVNVCLVEGTLVLMADGTTRKIEDILHSDWLRVWNFDEGRFDQAQPLWIKRTETTNQYNLLEFSDGSSLKTVYQHRIFNKELGAFTFPMTEDTPIGTTTFNFKGEEVTLISKQVVQEQVRYYNVITRRHMNLFANGILTSCIYNNVYPIVDMKFVKEDRELIPQAAFGVEDKYYEGLRLAEQIIPMSDTLAYIHRLELLKVDTQALAMAGASVLDLVY